MSSNYRKNKMLAIFRNDKPSLTDQSQAEETNVNIIMKKYRITGLAPGAARPPMFADFTQLPDSLKDLMDQSMSLPALRDTLPDKLRDMQLDELLSLTPQDLTNILTPTPQTPGAPTT